MDPASQPPSLQSQRILIADDDNTSRRLLAAVLRLRGARVDTVENGRLAVDRVLAGGYHIIFMDRFMPGLDGVDATRTIRQQGGALELLPIIGMTAFATDAEHVLFIEAGINEYLRKPIRQPDLWRVLRRWLVPSADGEAPGPVNYCPIEANPAHDDPDTSAWQLEFVSSLIADLAVRRGSLIDALDREDLPNIAAQAHTIAGAAGACGLDALHAAAARLEGGAREGNRSAVVAQMRKLFAEIDHVVDAHRSSA